MINYGDKIKQAYDFIHEDKREESLEILITIYNEILKLNYQEDYYLRNILLNTIFGIGEVYMKENFFSEVLKYFELGNKITNNKNFNLLFNLGVVYRNIGQEDKSKKVLELAKGIEPNNPNLLRFLSEKGIKSFGGDNYIDYRIEKDFINGGKRLYIFLYSICSFKCCFCDRGTLEYKEKFKGNDTTFDQVKKLIEEIDKNDFNSIAIGGNEPLTNININDILFFLDSLNIPLSLYTSGSEKNKLDIILSLKNIKVIFLPIYSTLDIVHDKIVGKKGAFKNLKEMEKILLGNNINVVYNGLIIKNNFLDLKYIKNNSFSLLHPRNEILYKKNAVFLTDFFQKIDFKYDIDFILDFHKTNGIPICFMSQYILKEFKNELLNKVINLFEGLKIKVTNEKNFHNYRKTLKCNDCFLNNYCLGYFKYYFEKFGEHEVKTIYINKII